jgi:hypothetical protein
MRGTLSSLPASNTLELITFQIDCVFEENVNISDLDPSGFLDAVGHDPNVSRHMECWDGDVMVLLQHATPNFSEKATQIMLHLDMEMAKNGRFKELVCSEWSDFIWVPSFVLNYNFSDVRDWNL